MTEGSSFVLMVDTIQSITEVLEKKYPSYYKGIVQNSRSGDIIEMTNKKQKDHQVMGTHNT